MKAAFIFQKKISLFLSCMVFLFSQGFAQTIQGSDIALNDKDKKSHQTLRLAGPPWIPFLSEENPTSGLATEIVIKALEKAGYQTSVSILPWRRVLAEAENNSLDVLIGLWKTSEREDLFIFSEPYYTNHIHFLGTKIKSVNHFSSLNNMEGYRIGLRKGASYGQAFDSAAKLTKVYVPNSLSMLRMLVLGRLDYGIGDRLILNDLIRNDPKLNGSIVFIEPEVASLPLHMAVVKTRKDHLKIITRFNLALQKMKEKGEVKSIYKRFGVE